MSSNIIHFFFLSFIVVNISALNVQAEEEEEHPMPESMSAPSVSAQNPLVYLQLALEKNLSKHQMNIGPEVPEKKQHAMNPETSAPVSAEVSELPGFPGASHLYHIGAKEFFLEHSKMLSLTREQQTTIEALKAAALSQKYASDQKINQAEQELWALTGSDRPDIKSIELKIREIESLRSEKRISFIRSVGEAAKILNEGQRSLLLKKDAKPEKVSM